MGEIACAGQGCAHRFWLPDAVERLLRRTGEKFFCPAGHRQYFTDEAHPERERIKELEDQLQRANERAERFRRRWEETVEQQAQLRYELASVREVVYGSPQLYECKACGHRHQFDSEVGQDHLDHAVLAVSLEADVDVGVSA